MRQKKSHIVKYINTSDCDSNIIASVATGLFVCMANSDVDYDNYLKQ